MEKDQKNIKNLRKLITIAKKSGLIRLKTPDFEFEFAPREPKNPPNTLPKMKPEERMPTEKELLYWSSPLEPTHDHDEESGAA